AMLPGPAHPLTVSLVLDGVTYQVADDWFEDGVQRLERALPPGVRLVCCVTCLFSDYCATSPRSSAPWARRRATVSWMSSTANMTRCRPSVLGGGFCGPAPSAAGAWYLVSSSLLWPSEVRIIAISLRTPLSPTVR